MFAWPARSSWGLRPISTTSRLAQSVFLGLDPFAFRNTRRRSFSAIITLRRCWRIDVGKQNLLFFLHVHDHLPSDIAERFLNVFNLVMFSSRLFSDPRQQCAETRDHVANIPVVVFFLRGISLGLIEVIAAYFLLVLIEAET